MLATLLVASNPVGSGIYLVPATLATACLLVYLYVCTAIWHYRENPPDSASAPRYRWIALTAMAVCVFVIAASDVTLLAVSAAIVLLTVPLYPFVTRAAGVHRPQAGAHLQRVSESGASAAERSARPRVSVLEALRNDQEPARSLRPASLRQSRRLGRRFGSVLVPNVRSIDRRLDVLAMVPLTHSRLADFAADYRTPP